MIMSQNTTRPRKPATVGRPRVHAEQEAGRSQPHQAHEHAAPASGDRSRAEATRRDTGWEQAGGASGALTPVLSLGLDFGTKAAFPSKTLGRDI